MRAREFIIENRLPREVEQHLQQLVPSDVGVDEVGDYRIHFEGFTDDCKLSSDYQANPEAVYQEVFNDFIAREGGREPIASGMVGDEEYPVLYSVFKADQTLTELRQSLDQYMKQKFPTWPAYVVTDMLTKGAKSFTSQEELQDWVEGIKHDYPVKQWRLQKLNITLSVFDNATQQRLIARKGGSANPYSVPNDAERHATQSAMIQKQGVSQEPIIDRKSTRLNSSH